MPPIRLHLVRALGTGLLSGAVLLASAGAARAATEAFAYDASSPLRLQTAATTRVGSAAVSDVTFAAGPAGESTGTLMRPSHPSGAAVLWVHWLGDAATSNRSEFRTEAQALAERGVTSLLVDAMWSKPDWFEKLRTPATDETDLVGQVVALRRALDVLAAQPGVDPGRIALVGHDFGAMYGALAASADSRVGELVLMTPALSFWEWFLFGAPPADVAAYVRTMSAYDLPQRLPSTHAHAVLFQFAKRDPYVAQTTAAAARALLADRDRTIVSYDAGHPLDEKARTDRTAWLVKHLGLRGP